MSETEAANEVPLPEVALRVENLTKKFDGYMVLKKVSFELYRGEVLGFLGPNGAGKTTTMRILTGFFPPTEGKVWIGDKELYENPQAAKKQIGYLPESVSIYPDMRVAEFLEFAAQIKGVRRKKMREHIEEKMERCGLFEVRRRVIGTLSKGYRQRLGIAQALIGDPEIIVLDEPTNGLDPKQIIEIRSLIRELGREKTLILSTHILPEVSHVCNRVLIMNKGAIVASGTSEELEAGLKKTSEIYLVVGGVSNKQAALEVLGKISGVQKVTVVDEHKDQVSITLVMPKGEDVRAEITRLFVERKIPLLEIRSGKLSLEDIFMKIVLNEDAQEPS